jgi:hypothetical protein
VTIWGTVAVILAVTLVVVTLGLNAVVAAVLSFIASYSWFIVAAGGLKTSESFAMAAGFGLMFMMPTSVGIGVAVLFGRLLLHFLRKGGPSPARRLLAEVKPAPVVDSVTEAVDLAASQFRVGSRIRVRCSNCLGLLSARQILSSTGRVPEIEINCQCGACFGVRPFHYRAA